MREIENVTRVEGKAFAAPSVEPHPKKTGTKPTVVISPEAIEAGSKSVITFYPTRSQEVALCALVAATPHLFVEAAKSPSSDDLAISDEAIDAAGEAIYSSCGAVEPWDVAGYRLRSNFRDDARTVLEAAMPHLTRSFRSVFWDDLAQDLNDPEFAETYAKESAKLKKLQ
jgi:hypothetical protein